MPGGKCRYMDRGETRGGGGRGIDDCGGIRGSTADDCCCRGDENVEEADRRGGEAEEDRRDRIACRNTDRSRDEGGEEGGRRGSRCDNPLDDRR